VGIAPPYQLKGVYHNSLDIATKDNGNSQAAAATIASGPYAHNVAGYESVTLY